MTNAHAEIRDARRARVQEKLMQLFFIALTAYVLGIATVVWMLPQ